MSVCVWMCTRVCTFIHARSKLYRVCICTATLNLPCKTDSVLSVLHAQQVVASVACFVQHVVGRWCVLWCCAPVNLLREIVTSSYLFLIISILIIHKIAIWNFSFATGLIVWCDDFVTHHYIIISVIYIYIIILQQ